MDLLHPGKIARSIRGGRSGDAGTRVSRRVRVRDTASMVRRLVLGLAVLLADSQLHARRAVLASASPPSPASNAALGVALSVLRRAAHRRNLRCVLDQPLSVAQVWLEGLAVAEVEAQIEVAPNRAARVARRWRHRGVNPSRRRAAPREPRGPASVVRARFHGARRASKALGIRGVMG